MRKGWIAAVVMEMLIAPLIALAQTFPSGVIPVTQPTQVPPAPPPAVAQTREPRSIHEAADAGDLSWVQHFVNAGTDVNDATVDGYTALFFAVQRQKPELVRWLLDNGADAN